MSEPVNDDPNPPVRPPARQTTSLLVPEVSFERFRRARQLPSYPYNITRATLFSSYANILLVFLPLGVVANALGWVDPIVFVLNLLAVIPLASLIAFSTRELSGSVGLVFGRLLKATLSNIFEIIVCVPIFACCVLVCLHCLICL